MLKVRILKPNYREMKGTAKVSGKPYHLAFQDAYFYTFGDDGQPNELPDRAEIMLDKDEAGNFKAYPPGVYQLHPSSIMVGRDGLAITPKLVPVPAKG